MVEGRLVAGDPADGRVAAAEKGREDKLVESAGDVCCRGIVQRQRVFKKALELGRRVWLVGDQRLGIEVDVLGVNVRPSSVDGRPVAADVVQALEIR